MEQQKSSFYSNHFVPANDSLFTNDEASESRNDGLTIRKFYEELTKNADSKEERKSADEDKNRPQKSLTVDNNSDQGYEVNSLSRTENSKDKVRKCNVRQIDKQKREFQTTNNLFRSINEGNLAGFKELFENSSLPIDIIDQYTWTPLMCATAAGRVDFVNYLLGKGASVYSPTDGAGMSAWDIAVKLDKTEIIDIFFQRRVKTEKMSPKEIESKDKATEMCSVCNVEFEESERSKHLSSTAHLFQQYKDRNCPSYYHLASDNVGYRILKETGWSEDKGLGPEGKGEKNPVPTILKRDRSGFGMKNNDRKRVTHFQAHDRAAVKQTNFKKIERVQKKFNIKRDMDIRNRKSKRWEMDLRSYMNSE